MITLLSILLLGFFLGMRHATDSDHVVAVTTIVSRQRSLGSAALTGILWGIGHSLTLLVVGGAIIFFGIVIPERLGLSLEFCVALMLVLLGALNLRVAMRSLRVDPVLAAEEHDHVHRHGDYVHTHAHGHESGNHGHSEDSVPPARLDRIFGRVEMVSRDPANRHRRRAWPRWFGRSRAPCPAHYSATHLGPGLPHRFWPRHRHGHDVDDGDDRGAHRLHCSF